MRYKENKAGTADWTGTVQLYSPLNSPNSAWEVIKIRRSKREMRVAWGLDREACCCAVDHKDHLSCGFVSKY